VKRRWRIDRDPSVSAVRAAVEDARTLAGSDAQTEPAALFFAFARRPRAFPGARRLMPANRMLVDIAGQKLTFDDVCEWFASHQVSRTP
jgi:hypothetical protein